MTLSKAINKLRTNANLSQEQFATLFNVSQQSVQKWEKGEAVSKKVNMENTNSHIFPIGMCISVLKEIILNM